jgi:hypothetical protein
MATFVTEIPTNDKTIACFQQSRQITGYRGVIWIDFSVNYSNTLAADCLVARGAV